MEITIDPALLVAATRFNAVNGILVVNRLVLAAPGDLTPDQRRSLRDMDAVKKELEGVREERAMQQPAKVRGFVTPFNASWGALSSVLDAICSLPPDVGGARLERAMRVRALLFPEDGAPSLQVDAETAYVEANERLERIERQDLEGEIVELCGREHLEAVKKTTAALGEILGVGKAPRPAAASTSMAEVLKRVSRAVAKYARKIVADLDEDDPASVARVAQALAPLIEHKAALGRARGQGAAGEGGAPNGEAPSDGADAPAAPVAPPADPTA